MNKDTFETLAAWGDQETRSTAALLDLVIAGTIDHLRGHGTVKLLPARLEEIVPRIEKRQRGEDGAWLITLLPPSNDLVPVNPYDVMAYVHEQGHPVGDIERHERTAFIRAAAEPGATLSDLVGRYPDFVQFVDRRYMHSVDNRPG